jgi:hypothetical protein
MGDTHITALLTADRYLLYFIWAVFFMQSGRKMVNVSNTKPVNDAESEYSFSTMPSSTVRNLPTMPPSRVASPTPPRYFNQAGPSHEANRISDAPSYYSEAGMPRKN